jgi:hypothetical protein
MFLASRLAYLRGTRCPLVPWPTRTLSGSISAFGASRTYGDVRFRAAVRGIVDIQRA